MSKLTRFRFFKTTSNLLGRNESTVFDRLKTKLQNSKIESRIIKIHPNNENSDEDILSFFAVIDSSYLFGLILRVSKKEAIKAMPINFANMDNLSFNQLPEFDDNTHEKYCKSHYYFMLKGNYLVTSLPSSTTIVRFQEYINNLLNQEEKYTYTPMINTTQLPLSSISKILVKDSSISGQIGDTGKAAISKMDKVKNYVIKRFFTEMPSMRTIDSKHIIKAELSLKISKPSNMPEEDYKRALSAFLQPIADAQNIIIYTNQGKISGEQLCLEKTQDVEENNGQLDENNIMTVMKALLNNNCNNHV